MRSKLWYIVTIVACALLPLAGCSGGGSSPAKQTSKGVVVTVGGKVDSSVAKSVGKSVFLSATSAAAANNVFVYDAQTGAQLGTAPIDGSGSFSNLSFTLPAAKTVLVFKAIVAQGIFRDVVPVDLSNPPAPGVITGSNPINIIISQDSTNIATTVSALLGLTGVLGDPGATLASVNKTYTDVAALVRSNGGLVLAYSTSGLTLTGSVPSASLLPARDASTLTSEDLNNIALDGKIISAFIPGKKPIVNFQVVNKATGKGISGLKTFGLHVAKLMPELNGSSSYWVNYIDNGIAVPAGSGTAATAATKPSADPGTSYNADGTVKVAGYTVIDHGDGSYTAVFASDITSNPNAAYDPTAIHRIGVTVTSVAVPGVAATGPINPATGAVSASFGATKRAALVYDFTPVTGAMLTDAVTGKQKFTRDIVTTAACNQCHDSIADIGGHQAARPDTRVCVMCHTSTNTSGEGDFVTLIHRIHMGARFTETNPTWKVPTGVLDVVYGSQTYPQDIRNCTMCHKGVDGNNWKTKPTRKNCGSCHNATDFTTHQGGQTSDTSCAACHTGAIASVEISAAHLAVLPPDPNSPELGGTNTHTYAGYLPAAGAVVPGAATVTWNVKSVSVDANSHPTITFKFTKNGSDVVFNTFAAGTVTELMNGFVGSPSAYFAFSAPQDGIAAPADFNATASAYIKNVWNGKTATSTLSAAPDANGYYTLTINDVTVPATATMFTGGIGYTYGSATTPLTQIDLPAYPYVAATNVGGLMTVVPNVWSVGTGFTGRRAIVSNAKCNVCHVKLGIAPTFHSGQRNDAPTCSFCHTVNRVNSGWSVNAKDAIHAIHAAGKRTNKFSWEVSAGATYWNITYPGYLRDCEQCHLPGTYDFSASASSAAVPNLLWSTVAADTTPATISSILLGTETVPGTYYSPFVAANTVYGNVFSLSKAGVATPAAATTLVNSPISAACFACHDTSADKAHMVTNGGSIYEARSTAFAKSEQCLVCHGTSNTFSIKAVHRWW